MKCRNPISIGGLSARSEGSPPRRTGFSMVEMMVVIVIILVLSGVVYRIHSHVTQRAGRGRAVYQLELLRNILDEYYAVYGHYPPASGTSFTDTANFFNQNRYPGTWQNYVEAFGDQMDNIKPPGTTGLVYFIWLQYEFADSPNLPNPPSPAEILAYRNRWAHYLADLHNSYDLRYDIWNPDSLNPPQEGGDKPYSNLVANILDPYNQPFEYQVGPNLQSYTLYSRAPDGDIGRDRWSE